MRTSNEHGKTLTGWLLVLTAAVCLSLAGLAVFLHRSKPSPKAQLQPNAVSKSQTLQPTSTAESPISPTKQIQKQNDLSEARSELEREMERELERESEMERERYDKPGEATRYLTARRLPEGETELQIEPYLEALEKARDLPQFSTLQNRLLPSRRAMANNKLNGSAEETTALAAWTPLGPGNIGGRTRALLVNPRNPEIMYAAGVAGGVWKTTDGGRLWQPLTDLLPTLSVCALVFDPNNPDVIYAGTGEGYFNADATRGAGIFRSFDGGNTWRQLEGTRTANFHYVNDIVISRINPNRIYAATRYGVMRSLDGGVTWTAVVNESINGGCSDLAIRTDQPTDVVFAACGIPTNIRTPGNVQAMIYRNDNASGLGLWEVVHTEEGMSRTSLAIAPSNQNVIYAASSENGAAGMPHSLHAVFRSTNGGQANSWVKVNNSQASRLNSAMFTNPIWAFQSDCRAGGVNQFFAQGWFDNVIAVDPLNENIVWVGGIDLFRSDDGGANWGMASFWHEPKTSARYVHADQHVIVFHPQFNGSSNRTMFVGNDGGIFRTENARAQTVNGNRAPCSSANSKVTWTSLNNGYEVTQFYHGAAFPDGARYLGGAQDNGVILGSDMDGTNGWRELLSGDGGYVAVDPYNTNIIYGSTNGLSLMKSTDGGANFRSATNNINNVGFGFIVPFVMDPSDSNRLWLGGQTLWRTKNGADSWTPASQSLTGTPVTAIAVAQDDGNFVLAGTDQGYIHRTTIGLNSTADTVWPNTRPRSGTVSSLAFDPTNRDIAYATYSTFNNKHVWKSVNGGASWISIDGALPDIPVNCIVVDPTNTQRLYIGTDIGVFASPDGGTTWAVENTGFANAPVEWLSLGQFGGMAHLFAFTRGRGAWRVPLGQVCAFNMTPQNDTFEVVGGQGEVSVTTTEQDCSWAVENRTGWITINSATSMQGTGKVKFTVAASNEAAPRQATIAIAGKSFTVNQTGVAVSVSAASLTIGTLAPESIVTVFGAGLAEVTQVAGGAQLPINMAGTVLKVRDANGVERLSPLFFISPNQINYLLPSGLAAGPAAVTIYKGNEKLFNSQIDVAHVAPGFFTVNSSGSGYPVGQVLRYKPSEPNQPPQQELLVSLNGQARPIDLGPDLGSNSDQVFLVLYGTGFRFRSSLENVVARIGGEIAPVHFAGAQGDFVGLDQINIQIPRSLIGRGEVNLALTVDGKQANIVKINIK
jgi:uncharacterized protein (TIGR03437 family)